MTRLADTKHIARQVVRIRDDLGYGGSFYDRTLADLLNRFRPGCACASRQVDSVPLGPYDIRLDAVETENGIIRCGG